MVCLRDYLKSVWCLTLLVIFIMVDYAAEIEVWSNGEVKREEITNCDELPDYLAET